jgi:hypothetical protein
MPRHLALSVNDALLPTPLLGTHIDTKMPKSFVLLLGEWRNRGLGEFRNFKFRNSSSPALSQAYAKRKYLYDTCAKRGGSLDDTDRALDQESGALSMTQFYRQLHDGDDTIVRHQKRPNPEDTPGPFESLGEVVHNGCRHIRKDVHVRALLRYRPPQ